MNILDRLHEEHEMVKSVLAEIEASSTSRPSALLKPFRPAAAPRRHERAAEQHSTPAVVVRLPVPRELSEDALVRAMKERIERHIQEEEFEVWKNVRKFLSADQRRIMDARFGAGKVFGNGKITLRA